MNASISTKQLLESIIREELLTLKEKYESGTIENFPPSPVRVIGGPDEEDIDLPVVNVTAYSDPAKQREFTKFKELSKKINELHHQNGLPRGVNITYNSLIPRGNITLKQLKKATKILRNEYVRDKKQFKLASKYLKWAKSNISSYESELVDQYNKATQYDIIGIRDQQGKFVTGRKVGIAFSMMRDANKQEARRKKRNSAMDRTLPISRNSMFMQYYNDFGKWIDPNVNRLTDDEKEQLKIIWGPMSAIANAFRTNPFLGVVMVFNVAVYDALSTAHQIGKDIVASLDELLTAWSTWDGFINHKKYGIRTAAYSPAGIAIETVIGMLGPEGAGAVAIFFALLVIDDIIKISQGEYRFVLDLILDLLAVFLGSKAAISKPLFAGLKLPLTRFFRNGYKWSSEIIIQLFDALKKLAPNALQLIDDVARGIASIFSSIKSTFKTIIGSLKQSIKEYPVLRSFLSGLQFTIQQAYNLMKIVLNAVIGLFKGIAAIIRFIFKIGTTPIRFVYRKLFEFLERQGINIGKNWRSAIQAGTIAYGTAKGIHVAYTGYLQSQTEKQYKESIDAMLQGEDTRRPEVVQPEEVIKLGEEVNIKPGDTYWYFNDKIKYNIYISKDPYFTNFMVFDPEGQADNAAVYELPAENITDYNILDKTQFKVQPQYTDSLSPSQVLYVMKLRNPGMYQQEDPNFDFDSWDEAYIMVDKRDLYSENFNKIVDKVYKKNQKKTP